MRIGLRLIATSDLHAHVLAHDYAADRPLLSGGLDRTAVLIEAARAEAAARGRASLLLDCGDFLHGTLLSDWAVAARAPVPAASRGLAEAPAPFACAPAPPPPDAARGAPPDPVVAAMNRLGYDAAALGNHELDEAPATLALALAPARFAVLCAGAPAGRHPPSTIVEREAVDAAGRRRPLRVGVVGVLPPRLVPRGRRAAHGWPEPGDVGDLARAVRAEAGRLRTAGADVVAALCHAGFAHRHGGGEGMPGGDDGDGSDAALRVAADGGVDAVICGHTHHAFPGPGIASRRGVDPRAGRLAGVPAVMPGWRGSHLGVIDLDLEPGPPRRVVGARAELRAARDLPPDASAGLGADPDVARAHAAARREAGVVVGRSPAPLSTALAHVGVSGALDLMTEAQRAEARALLAGTAHARTPLLVAVSPAHAGGRRGAERFTDVPAGPVARRHVAELHAHGDALVVLRVTGAELRRWLERAALRFAPLAPGACDAPLLDEAVPSYDFDVIYGARYALDPSRAPGADHSGASRPGAPGRLAALEHDGRPVAPDAVFAVAVKSHRVSGEGLHAALAEAPVIARSPRSLRCALARHLAARRSPVPPPGSDWRLAPVPGATALFPAPLGAALPPGGRVPSGRVSSAGRRGGACLLRLHL